MYTAYVLHQVHSFDPLFSGALSPEYLILYWKSLNFYHRSVTHNMPSSVDSCAMDTIGCTERCMLLFLDAYNCPRMKNNYLVFRPSKIYKVVRLELAPICVAQSFLQHFAPFELHINIKTLLNTPPYEKYTFSEWKLHEESKSDIQKCIEGRVRMSGLRKSTFLDQIWNFPSCVISPYPQPLLPIYHRI